MVKTCAATFSLRRACIGQSLHRGIENLQGRGGLESQTMNAVIPMGGGEWLMNGEGMATSDYKAMSND